MLVLGLNAYHADASAALVRDGEILAAIAEERINRIKHFSGFPMLAIHEALRIAGVRWQDVDAVAVGRDGKANLLQKVGFALLNLPRIGRMAKQRLENRADVAAIDELLTREFGSCPRVVHVEHHLAHAASCYLTSPFEQSAILTLDGMGDFTSVMLAAGEGENIKVLDRVHYPHSPGIFYTAVCQFIGYDRYGDEGKIMGLAAYGDPAPFRSAMEKLLLFKPGGGLELGLDYFTHHVEGVDYAADPDGRPTVGKLFHDKLATLLGGPPLPRGEKLTQREMDISAAMQERLEQYYAHVLNALHRAVGGTNLCLAGGVALNSLANGKIHEFTPFRHFNIHPAAGDDGTATGAALWVGRHGSRRVHLQTASLGNSYTDDAIAEALAARASEIRFEKVPYDDLITRTADAIAQGLVLGWFQGRMEWGPRALGNRSILALPGHPGMKDILNARIKHREWFRPFAPVVIEERLADYFEADQPEPFMLRVFRTREDKRGALTAVDHEDHTGRVQTVSREVNPPYYDVVKKVGELTGTPVVINTSFNENEPIVYSPAEAIDCFLRTKMDRLAIGSFWCTKDDGQKPDIEAGAAKS